MEALSSNILSADSVFANIPDSTLILKMSLRSLGGNPVLEIMNFDGVSKIPVGLSGKTTGEITFPQITEYAQRWCDGGITRVDTLYSLEQWIPFSYLKRDFPIYKFYFDDNDKHQLYVSSVTGEALQFTNKNNRFWAWLGAIPHWIYFTSLRQDTQLWTDVIVWLSGIGCIMCIAGIILGIRSYIVQYRKKKKWKTPYKTFPYKWHHIMGFIFGIFVFTFTLSGMMSLADVPGWIVKVHNPAIQQSQFMPQPIIPQLYKLDFHKILDKYPGKVKSIEWSSFGTTPLYKVTIDNKQEVINASSEDVIPLQIDKEMILNKISQLHNEPVRISLMTEYDNYYVGLTDHLPLPVFKVDILDADKSTYYINPENGNTRYFNTNTKVHRWLYQALHSYKFKYLAERPILWNIVMWVTMIGGTLVSITGVWLGFRYVKRKIKKVVVK